MTGLEIFHITIFLLMCVGVYKFYNRKSARDKRAAALAKHNEEISKLNVLEREQLAAMQSKSTTGSWVGAFLLMGPIGLMMNSHIQRMKTKKARAKLGL